MFLRNFGNGAVSEGRNIAVVYRYADEPARLLSYAEELSKLGCSGRENSGVGCGA
jgi:hypothetical protein